MASLTSIVFTPLVPLWLIAVLTALFLAAVGFALWRRASGTWLRALAATIALGALANPSAVTEERDPLADVVVLVVDDSPSQRIGERRAETEAALAALKAKLRRWPDLDVREVRIKDDAEAIARDFGTRRFRARDRALGDTPDERLAASILITDGQAHDAIEAAEAGRGAPVHVLLTGREDERDRRLVIEDVPRYGIVGKRLKLALKVEEQGPDAPAAVPVVIRQDGKEIHRFRAGPGVTRDLSFTLEHGGQTAIEIEIEAGPSELTLLNNRAAVMVNGVRDRLRVLLVSGEPYAGERTWRNLLKADPSVDLIHFTILRPPEKQDGTPVNELSLIAFPTRELFEIKLNDFDLIIFDRYRRRGVLPRIYLQNIAGYVRNGGAVLEAAGPSFAGPLGLYRTPLGEVLPGRPTGQISTGPFRPLLTDLGHRHPVTADLPGADQEPPSWGHWYRMIDVEVDRGSVLMTGLDDGPILVLDRIGEGRVAKVLSDHGWLWARGYEGGGPQAELLRRVAHWLMKEPELEEDDLTLAADGDKIRIERRRLVPDDSPVTLTTPSGETMEITLEEGRRGLSHAILSATEPGLYQARDARDQAIVAVGALNPREFADVRSTEKLLAPVAEASGGGLYRLAGGAIPDLRRLGADRTLAGRTWIGLARNERYIVTGVEQTSLAPPLLVMLLLLAATVWAWRREAA